MPVYPTTVIGSKSALAGTFSEHQYPLTLMEDGKRKKSALLFKDHLNKTRKAIHDKGTDLFEHVVYRVRWDAVAFEVDESHLLESVHNFLGRIPLFRERIRMSIFAEIDQGNSKCLVGTGILNQIGLNGTLWVK